MALKSNTRLKIEDIVKAATYLTGLTGFLSVVKHISLAYSGLFMVLCLSSLYFDFKKTSHIPRWLLNITSLMVIFFSYYRLSLANLVVPAVEGLVLLICIKFLEQKRFRDYMQIYAISLFLLAGSALLSIDIVFMVYFVCMIFLLAGSMVLLTYYSQEPDLSLTKGTLLKIVSKSLLIPLLSIPMTMLLFVILPRSNYPFFNFLNQGTKARTGFTDNVKLGDVTDIQEDESIILRARMERIDEGLLYWRGMVLDYFNGTTWRKSRGAQESKTAQDASLFPKIRQTIYLEPYGNKYLFALDRPQTISVRGVKSYSDVTFSLSGTIEKRIRYEAVSVLSASLPEETADRQRYLQLPENIAPEINMLVKDLSRDKTTGETIKSILSFLRGGNYRYSLENLPITKNPIEAFLFKHKFGNCEYFASAMAVMLRTAGIPARVVVGYRGGEYNEVGKYYLVAQKNAHVWIEAYEGNKWLRLDPTPASAESLAKPDKNNVLFKLRLLFDTVSYYWNAFVINYDFEKQVSILHKIGSGMRKPDLGISIDIKTAGKFIVILAGVAAAAFIAITLILRKRSEEERLLALFLKKLGKHGYTKKESQGLEEFVSGIEDERLRGTAQKFAEEFEGYFYRDRKPSKEETIKLRKLLSLIEKGNKSNEYVKI